MSKSKSMNMPMRMLECRHDQEHDHESCIDAAQIMHDSNSSTKFSTAVYTHSPTMVCIVSTKFSTTAVVHVRVIEYDSTAVPTDTRQRVHAHMTHAHSHSQASCSSRIASSTFYFQPSTRQYYQQQFESNVLEYCLFVVLLEYLFWHFRTRI